MTHWRRAVPTDDLGKDKDGQPDRQLLRLFRRLIGYGVGSDQGNQQGNDPETG
ncbi:hypothetical protein ABZ920_10055 [Streptomyces sp. NPDC046831]|uniref:hypothetical protein n=1 Tax=Streptomyces sp. NPDC046831 TaxID=3154805 RepID=UPI0033E2ABCE